MANKHLSEDKIQYTIVIPNWGYIFIKSFKKTDGSRYYYFTSVTVSIDGKEVVVSNQEKSRNRILRLLIEGNVVWRTVAKEGLEISVSSHFVNPNKMKNKLMEFERAYTKETLLPNSSEMRLTEHQSDVPDLLPTQGNNVSSAGKDTQSSNNEQGSSVKNQESDAIPTDEEVGITQSNSVLQGEEVDNSRGDNESQKQGRTIEVGTQGEVENGLVHQGAQGGVDKQGNPINADGTLKVDKVNSINELTDADFENPTRNVELPTLPQNVDEAIGANGKPIVINLNSATLL